MQHGFKKPFIKHKNIQKHSVYFNLNKRKNGHIYLLLYEEKESPNLQPSTNSPSASFRIYSPFPPQNAYPKMCLVYISQSSVHFIHFAGIIRFLQFQTITNFHFIVSQYSIPSISFSYFQIAYHYFDRKLFLSIFLTGTFVILGMTILYLTGLSHSFLVCFCSSGQCTCVKVYCLPLYFLCFIFLLLGICSTSFLVLGIFP